MEEVRKKVGSWDFALGHGERIDAYYEDEGCVVTFDLDGGVVGYSCNNTLPVRKPCQPKSGSSSGGGQCGAEPSAPASCTRTMPAGIKLRGR